MWDISTAIETKEKKNGYFAEQWRKPIVIATVPAASF